MNFEKIKNQIMKLNIKEENMSFNEYKETIKSYALEKGMEYLENNRNKKEDYIEYKHVERAILYAFQSEFESFLGKDYSSLKEKVEFVSKRAEEFGLHLDEKGKILETQTQKNKEDTEEYIRMSKDMMEYIETDLNPESYFVKNLLRNEKERTRFEIEEIISEVQTLDFENNEFETGFVNIKDLKKIINKNSNADIEYFKQKDEVLKEFIKEKIKDDTTDTIMMNHVITENMRNLGYKNSYSLDDSDKINFVLNKEFPNYDEKYKYYKNVLLNEEKERNEKEIDFEK